MSEAPYIIIHQWENNKGEGFWEIQDSAFSLIEGGIKLEQLLSKANKSRKEHFRLFQEIPQEDL